MGCNTWFDTIFIKLIGISIFSRYTSLVNLHSIVTEPSHYVVVILPACVCLFLL